MVYRGFTWNLTASDVALTEMCLKAALENRELYRWEEAAAKRLLAQIALWKQVTPDGCTPTHAFADS